MKGTGRFKDINKISAIVGLITLVFLVVGLVAAIVVVSIHTSAYISYSESRIRDLKVEKGISQSCSTSLIKKASNEGDALTVNVEIKKVKHKNRDENGKCIILDALAQDDNDCEDEIEKEEQIVTISKIKKGFTVILTNDYDDSVLYITSDGKSLTASREGESYDTEYKVTKDSYSFYARNHHVIEVYTLALQYTKDDCKDALIRELKFETPKYNILANTQMCEGKEDYPNCQTYIYSDNPMGKSNYSLGKAIGDIENVDIKKYREEQNKESKTALIIVSIIVIVLLVVSICVAVIGVIKVRKGGALHENEIDENYDEDSSKTFDEYQKSIGEGSESNEINKK